MGPSRVNEVSCKTFRSVSSLVSASVSCRGKTKVLNYQVSHDLESNVDGW